jgi:hypothetical protein
MLSYFNKYKLNREIQIMNMLINFVNYNVVR